jgi:hypothetical protein
VTSTSTRVPGTTKPATAVTSLTLTASARIPTAINVDKPAPAFSAASLSGTTNSPFSIGSTAPRPTADAFVRKTREGRSSGGYFTILRSRSPIFAPTWISLAATTTSTPTFGGAILACSLWYTTKLKAAPRTSATIPITSSRVRSIFDSLALGKACSCSPALSIPFKSGTLGSAPGNCRSRR